MFGIPAGISAAAELTGYVAFVPQINWILTKWRELTRDIWVTLFGWVSDYVTVPFAASQYDALTLLFLASTSIAVTLARSGQDALPIAASRWQSAWRPYLNMLIVLFPGILLIWLFSVPSGASRGSYVQIDMILTASLILLSVFPMVFFVGLLRKRATGLTTLKGDPFMRKVSSTLFIIAIAICVPLIAYEVAVEYFGGADDAYSTVWLVGLYSLLIIVLFGAAILNWKALYYIIIHMAFVIAANLILIVTMPVFEFLKMIGDRHS